MLFLEILFWFSLAWIIYANLGYLAILWIIRRFIFRPVLKKEITPSLSFLVAAHNEEKTIAAKLENTLALDYPKDRLEIFVMSDATTDRTEEIVSSFSDQLVKLNSIPVAGGKPNAMNLTVPITSGEIILISDADSRYEIDSLRKLVRNFADPMVGAVTGKERRVAGAAGSGYGEDLYNRIDNRIKRLEGETGCMVMVNGGFVAIRRELYPFLDPTLNFDLVWAPLLKLKGYRTAYEPEAVSTEVYPLDSKSDFRRRIRTVLQAFYSYLSVPQALNPFRTGWYAVKLFSHRFTRWFVVPWLLVALITNVLLWQENPLFFSLLIIHLVCYLFAVIGWGLDRIGKRIKIFYIPFYFLYIHLAASIAVTLALMGRRVTTWKPTLREPTILQN